MHLLITLLQGDNFETVLGSAVSLAPWHLVDSFSEETCRDLSTCSTVSVACSPRVSAVIYGCFVVTAACLFCFTLFTFTVVSLFVNPRYLFRCFSVCDTLCDTPADSMFPLVPVFPGVPSAPGMPCAGEDRKYTAS